MQTPAEFIRVEDVPLVVPGGKTEPQLDESRVLVVIHARVRVLENTSPHRWESRTDLDPSRNVLPRRNERIEESRSTFHREGFPHCVTITRHAGRTGLDDMRSEARVVEYQHLCSPPDRPDWDDSTVSNLDEID